MKLNDGIKKVGREQRVKDYLLPIRIILTNGNVSNAESLLKEKSLQVHLNEPEVTILENNNNDENAGVLLDFGKEINGSLRIITASTKKVEYPRIRIRFGESVSEALAENEANPAVNDHSIRDISAKASIMSDQEWGETGFRFAYIELTEPDAVVNIKSILAAFVYRDIPYLGDFKCDNELINEIFDVSAYTCHLCMQNMLVDGIKRDRLVWIGDSHPEMLTIRSVFGNQKMLEDSLDEMCKITPLTGWMNNMPAYSLWWILIMWDWYDFTGNISYAQKHKNYILGLTENIISYIADDGKFMVDSYFLDWPSCETPDAEIGVHALLILALRAAQNFALIFEEPDFAKKVINANSKVEKRDFTVKSSKPAAALTYLAGIAQSQKTAQLLCEGNSRGMSTFMSYYILKAVSETENTEKALSMLCEYYGGMLKMGATSFWEDFSIDWLEGSAPLDRIKNEGERDIHADFGDFCYKGLRHSLCHGWSSGPAPFLLEKVLGITFEKSGGKKIKINPSLGSLKWAEGTYPLPDGNVIWVRCEAGNGKININFKAPEGVEVVIEE